MTIGPGLRTLLALSVAVGFAQMPIAQTPNTLTSAERSAGWRVLFDGRTTKGWHAFGTGKTADESGWTVTDGTLVALGQPANAANDIVTDDEFENFDLVVDWKLSPQANSGIFFNVVEQGYKEIYATGPEYQLIDEDGWPGKLEDWQKAGANYAMQPPLAKAIKLVGEWNHTRIFVDRGHVTGWMNDIKTAEYQMWTPEWNASRLAGKWKDYPGYGQAHTGKLGLQNHGNKIWFRNIKVRVRSPSGTGA